MSEKDEDEEGFGADGEQADLLEMSDIDTLIGIVTLMGTHPLMTHGMSEDSVFNVLHRGDRPPVDKTASARKVASLGVIMPPEGHRHAGRACVHVEMLFGMLKAAGRGLRIGRTSISTAKSTKLPFLMEVLGDFVPIESETEWVPDIKRCTGQTGTAVAGIRPRWDDWSITFIVRLVLAYGFTPQLAFQILDNAGAMIGLGGYRPSRNGRFGLFKVTRFHYWDGGKLPRPTFGTAAKVLDGPPKGWTMPALAAQTAAAVK